MFTGASGRSFHRRRTSPGPDPGGAVARGRCSPDPEAVISLLRGPFEGFPSVVLTVARRPGSPEVLFGPVWCLARTDPGFLELLAAQSGLLQLAEGVISTSWSLILQLLIHSAFSKKAQFVCWLYFCSYFHAEESSITLSPLPAVVILIATLSLYLPTKLKPLSQFCPL